MAVPSTLSRAALTLRNAAPEEWEAFKHAFGKTTYDATVAVTEASTDQILKVQGHAQAHRFLERLFHECDKQLPSP